MAGKAWASEGPMFPLLSSRMSSEMLTLTNEGAILSDTPYPPRLAGIQIRGNGGCPWRPDALCLLEVDDDFCSDRDRWVGSLRKGSGRSLGTRSTGLAVSAFDSCALLGTKEEELRVRQ